MTYHLAQINIARLVAPLPDPRIVEFAALLEPINALADEASGFVWRLKSETGDATDIAYNDDPFVIVNMSVWESVEALRTYAYKSDHAKVFRDRPNGLKSWKSPVTASGGFHSATLRALPRVASAWITIRRTARRRTLSGSRSTSLSPRMKASASSTISAVSTQAKRPAENSGGRFNFHSRF